MKAGDEVWVSTVAPSCLEVQRDFQLRGRLKCRFNPRWERALWVVALPGRREMVVDESMLSPT